MTQPRREASSVERLVEIGIEWRDDEAYERRLGA